MAYPSVSELLSGDDKDCLLGVHRSLRSVFPLIFGFLFSAVAVYQIIAWTDNSEWLKTLPLLRHISPRWLGLIPALFFLELLRRHHDDLYIFTDSRIQHKAGRLSLNYRIPSVKFVDIRSIRVVQSVWGRILGYGDIELGTAAQADSELVLQGVLAPRELAELVEDLRATADASQGQSRKDD